MKKDKDTIATKDFDPERRVILKGTVATALAIAFGSLPRKVVASYKAQDHWYGFVVDLTKCIGCGACVRACKAENDVPDGFFRTWVERYTFLKDGKVIVDSPDGGLNGFQDNLNIPKSVIAKTYFVPKLCNHCATAPCVQVCPVGATFVSQDGVVLVDKKHCIGCGYCIQACPYGSRFLSPHGYADKCTLCYHRIRKGDKPACVLVCPVGARLFGDLKDKESNINKVLAGTRHGVLKPELGTTPKCFYIGLDQEVR
jgi:tetrathionate reductase subunit B